MLNKNIQLLSKNILTSNFWTNKIENPWSESSGAASFLWLLVGSKVIKRMSHIL